MEKLRLLGEKGLRVSPSPAGALILLPTAFERSSVFMSLVLILLLVICCINLFTRDIVILINVY